MNFVEKLSYQSLVDLIDECNKSIFWVSPSLTVEIAHALAEEAKKGKSVHVVTDINPDRFKHFEGEFKAVEILKEVPNLKLKTADNVGLGFFIIDDMGFAFFNPLRAYEKDGERFNAFQFGKETSELLKSLFFNLSLEAEPNEPNIFTAKKKEDIQKDLNIHDLKDKGIEETKKELEKDPPLNIDFQQIINIYRAYFQFVEVKFKGSNFHIKKVKLPRNALPIKDTALKKSIESNLRLFSNIPQKGLFQPFFDLKDEWDKLRESYITYINAREKNVIKKEDISKFEDGYHKIKKRVENVKRELNVKIQGEIFETETRIRDNLKDFFKANRTDKLKGMEGYMLENGAENEANKIVSKIKFPSADKLLCGLSIEKHYYDITWEDLNNEEVIKEFKTKGLIDEGQAYELKSMSKAFEVHGE
jgi:hypothetical protein